MIIKLQYRFVTPLVSNSVTQKHHLLKDVGDGTWLGGGGEERDQAAP